VTGALMRWLSKPGNADQLAEQLAGQMLQIVRVLPAAELGDAVDGLARRGIERIPAAPLAAKVLSVLWAGGAAQTSIEPWFSRRVTEAPRVVDLSEYGFPLIGGRVDGIGRPPYPFFRERFMTSRGSRYIMQV
jgi:anti-sigma factor RsiW